MSPTIMNNVTQFCGRVQPEFAGLTGQNKHVLWYSVIAHYELYNAIAQNDHPSLLKLAVRG